MKSPFGQLVQKKSYLVQPTACNTRNILKFNSYVHIHPFQPCLYMHIPSQGIWWSLGKENPNGEVPLAQLTVAWDGRVSPDGRRWNDVCRRCPRSLYPGRRHSWPPRPLLWSSRFVFLCPRLYRLSTGVLNMYWKALKLLYTLYMQGLRSTYCATWSWREIIRRNRNWPWQTLLALKGRNTPTVFQYRKIRKIRHTVVHSLFVNDPW